MMSLKSPLAQRKLSKQRKLRKPVFNFDYRFNDIQKLGIVSLPEAWTRENCRPLQNDINASDTIRFCGVNKDGGVIIAGMTRRPNRRMEVVLYLRLPSGDEYQLPTHPDTNVYDTDGHSFSAAGLTFELLDPLRRWRVIFNGYLRKGISDNCTTDESEVVPARFNFIWHPIYSYLSFPDDFSDPFLLKLISKSGIEVPWDLFPEEWHEQFGELNGTINIEGQKECELFIRGLKSREHGIFDLNKLKQKLSIQGVLHNGTAFHLFVENPSLPAITSQDLVFGYVCLPCNIIIQYLRNSSLNVKDLQSSTDRLDIAFTAGDTKYKLNLESVGSEMKTFSGDLWECETTTRRITLTLNGKPGEGIMKFSRPNQKSRTVAPRKSLPMLTDGIATKCEKLVVNFSDPECLSNQVGGKAASLAHMTSLASHCDTFQVPSGVCVTKHAFEQHLVQNPELLNAIEHLQGVAWSNGEDDLQRECSRVEGLICESKISEPLEVAIEDGLFKSFGRNVEELKFAVRSSAIGEDGEDLSAAGQNETFLGVRGLIQEISQAVTRCWASQFSFRSVTYKRFNGQVMNGGMGVVIQLMVAADVAGVLFSRDPVTGSLARMVISSNYGLGESVVSGTSDPDSIILSRSSTDELSIKTKSLGGKKAVIKMAAGSGTVQTNIDTDASEEFSLTEEMALRLGAVALLLERSFGSARDIEWAFANGQLFLLQSRPVTTENVMTDFEIMHEFDTPLRTDNERLTTANLGEVMPGALVPLSVTSFVRVEEKLFQHSFGWKAQSHRYDPTVANGPVMFCGHAFFDRCQQKSFNLEKEKGAMTKSLDIGFYGRVLDDQDVVDMAQERYRQPPKSVQLRMLKWAIKGMMSGSKMVSKYRERNQSLHVNDLSTSTAEEAYLKVGERIWETNEVATPHIWATMASTFWNFQILNILASGSANRDFTLDQYSDFAMLIGRSNGAESGDVPYSLRNLVKSIAAEMDPQSFSQKSPEEALNWLRESGGESSLKFKEFLEKHGHRGLKEFDVYSISWGMNNIELVKVLQNMLKTPVHFAATSSADDEIVLENPIGHLKTPLSPIQKKLLAYMVKKGRRGVCLREETKSMVIKFLDCFRITLRHLAALMTSEGFIPDPNLIFFMTFEEIGILLKIRSAKLIRRARQRLKLNPYMDGLKFAEMVDGHPKPDDGRSFLPSTNLDGSVTVKGYPVSQGVVQGFARVVESFNDVHTIQAGEILITYSTDIGWSPYFPMLTGIATEIGGLVSHGAVVAREFGLPCIVGAENATRIFKSGDLVLLNATEGVLSKIELPVSEIESPVADTDQSNKDILHDSNGILI